MSAREMKHIVEYGYLRFPPAAARFYDEFMLGRATQQQVQDIAEELARSLRGGRLLDVGTGPGRLLERLHRLDDTIDLYGMDIAQSMIDRAHRNLAHFAPDLRCLSIRSTDYEPDYFDVVTCTGSFYVWRDPLGCLDEVHRVLKPGGRLIFFETHRDYSRAAYLRNLAKVMVRQGPLRGALSPLLLGQQLRMTYGLDELETIFGQTPFRQVELREMTIASLPIWVRIEARKG
jgi:ubiquinone/menaquinone biosynthesis C-methylase UbiE